MDPFHSFYELFITQIQMNVNKNFYIFDKFFKEHQMNSFRPFDGNIITQMGNSVNKKIKKKCIGFNHRTDII